MKQNPPAIRPAGAKPEPPAMLSRMYSDFCHQWQAERGLDSGPWLNIVLAYQDFPAGLHGFQVCRDLFEAVDQPCSFSFRNAWRFDFLRDNALMDRAVRESVCADMLVIAVHAPGNLPPHARWWIESTLEQRDGDPGALVLLLEGVAAKPHSALAVETYLTQCAQKGGMELFIKRAVSPRKAAHAATPAPEDDSAIAAFRRQSELETPFAAGELRTPPVLFQRTSRILRPCKPRRAGTLGLNDLAAGPRQSNAGDHSLDA